MSIPTPAKTHAESIYERLRYDILRGDLRPGDRLTEQEIARRMGTSQGPVREALARLRAQGLILSLPHRGSFVSEISAEQARDIYRIRLILEKQACALALPTLTNDDIAELRELVRDMVHRAAEDAGQNFERDMAFHRRLFEHAGSPTLLQFWDIIDAQTTKFISIASPRIFRDPVSIAKTHHALVDAIERRDLKLLEEKLDEHLLRIWNAIDAEE